jgi:putative membrane-bound dehydrogenase-like protein
MKRFFLSLILTGLTVAHAAGAPPLQAEALARIGRGEPLTPEQALMALKTEPGLRVDLAAAEPLTGDPVALAWDERGRLYVAENRGYPEGSPDGRPLGVIALLEDTNGDGRYDKRTEFAAGLTYPNGLTCWRGGIFVTCAPDILYLKDTDGDGRADVRKVVLTGFELGKTTQIRVAHPTLGPDGWIHLTSGLTGGKVTCPDHPERKPVEFTKNDSRFHPDTFEFEVMPGVAQFGLCFDDFGRKFTVDNRHPLQMVVLPPRYLKRNPYLPFSESVADVAASGDQGKVFPLARDQTTASMHPGLLHTPHAGTFTSSCGISIYGGDALPAEFQGNSITCEPAQALVQRQIITTNGAALKAQPARPGTELLVTADSWFRPVFSANAPDGALYIASMYRKFIDHPQYVPAEMRDKLDFISGRHQGRIYRVAAADWKPGRDTRKFDLGKASTKELVQLLESPRVWWRETARRLLLERNDPAAVAHLEKMLARGQTPQARAQALRALDNLGKATRAHAITALRDRDASVREVALQTAERFLDTDESRQSGSLLNLAAEFPRAGSENATLIATAMALTDDPAPRVRFQAVLALGSHDYRAALTRFAKMAVQDAGDRWARAAALSAAGKHPVEFLEAVLARAEHRKAPGASFLTKDTPAAAPVDGLGALLAEACRVVAASQPPESLPPLIAKLTSANSLDLAARAAAITGLGDALRPRKITLEKLTEGDATAVADARAGLDRLMRNSIALAADARQPLPARQAAVGLLAYAGPATAGEPLRALISPREPTEIQTAAARALLQLPDLRVATPLLEAARWRALTPPVREAVLAGLMSQPAGVKELLAAMEAGAVPPATIDPTRRNQLLKHRDKTVAAKAETLFKNLQGGDRQKVYEEYKSALALKPNVTNGHAIFTKTCAQCHVMNGEGARVGPELTGIRNQPAEVLLLHILVPSQEIVAGFNAYEIETKDGRTATGLLASETPTSVTLRRALGEEETILRSNIASMTAGTISLMPDELEKTMSRQDLRDLIAFLKAEEP